MGVAAATAINVQTRLESRWRDLQATWAYLHEAKAERRTAVDRWRTKIKATQEALDAMLREGDPADPTEHVRQCHAMHARLEAAKRSLESTRKRHDAIVSDCKTAFEAALLSDQLPLFGDAEISPTGHVELDGTSVVVGDLLYVRGRGAATVVGFRDVAGVEVVVLRQDDADDTFEAIPAVLSRQPPDEDDDENTPKRRRRKLPRVGDEVTTSQGEVGTLVRTVERDGEPWAAVAFGDVQRFHPLQELDVLKPRKRSR